MRVKKFAWLPKSVYSMKHWRDGYRWLSDVWLDDDGKYYITEKELTVDFKPVDNKGE